MRFIIPLFLFIIPLLSFSMSDRLSLGTVVVNCKNISGCSDYNIKFKDFNLKGCVICESPNIEEDALLLQKTFAPHL